MPPHDADAGPRPDNLDPRAAAGAGELAALAARETGRAAVTARAILEDGRAAMAAAYALEGWRIVPCRGDNAKAPDVPKGTGPADWPRRLTAAWRRAMRAGGPRNWQGTAPAGTAVLDLDRLDLAGPFLAALGWDAAPPPHVTTGRRPVPGWHVVIADWPEGMPAKLYALDAAGRAILEPDPKTGELRPVTLADVRRGERAGVVLPGGMHPDTGETYAAPTAPDWTPGALVTLDAGQRAALEEWATRQARALAEHAGGTYSAAAGGPPGAGAGDAPEAYRAAYWRGALERTCTRIAAAADGAHNDTLNAEARKLARYAAACGADHDAALAAMVAAYAGEDARRDPAQVWATARSGWRAGLREPRPIPPPRDDGPPSGPRGPRPPSGPGGAEPDGAPGDVAAYVTGWRDLMRALERRIHPNARSGWRATVDALAALALDAAELEGGRAIVRDGWTGIGAEANRSRPAARKVGERLREWGALAIVDRGGRDAAGRTTRAVVALTMPPGMTAPSGTFARNGAVTASMEHGMETAAAGDTGGTGGDGNPLNRSTLAVTPEFRAKVGPAARSAPLRGDACQHPASRRGKRAAAALEAMPAIIAAACALGAGRADLLQALADAGAAGATARELAARLEAGGLAMPPRTIAAALAAFVARGIAASSPGPAGPRGGRRATVYRVMPEASAALEAEVMGGAIRAGTLARAALEARAERVRRGNAAALDAATLEAADAGRRVVTARGKARRERCATRTRSAAAIAADARERAHAHRPGPDPTPEPPAELAAEWAAMAAASGWTLAPPDGAGELARTPAALDVAPLADAGPLDAGAILEAAGPAAAPSAAAPSEPEPMPAAIPGAPSAAMLEASRADAPAPFTVWRCRCGGGCTGDTCTRCGAPRGDAILTVLHGRPRDGGEPEPEPSADALEAAAALLRREAERQRAAERPALRIVDGPERRP